jgi:Domain of unknown function (DUF5979)
VISMRKAVAISATSALALAGLVASAANAQSTQVAINETVKVNNAAAPATITGYQVVTNCSSPTSTSQTAQFPGAGGGPFPVFFTVSSVNNCTFTVNGLAGTTVSNPASAAVSVSVGGTVRAASLALGVASPVVPIAAGTDAVFTITYPSVIIKKVVVGDEVVPGFDYPMAIGCQYNTTPPTQIPAVGGAAGTSFLAFKLKKDGTRTITTADFPGLVSGATCFVSELDNGGAGQTIITSTNADGTTSNGGFDPGKAASGTTPAVPARNVSAGVSASGQTVTITNSFVGDLIVSKVVTGDPKTAVAIYEINVSCNNNGPKETFLLKDRQSKLFTGITTGSSCLISETRSDGAEVTYNDNSGDNATDGRVTVKGTASGCQDKNLSGFPDCRANVIVNNSYVLATTTTLAPAATTPGSTSATLPPVAPAPPAQPETVAPDETVTG